MVDETQIAALLQGLPERASRSGLEPYRELVLEMRRRSFSYRQIAKLLVERCDFKVSHSAIHDFVRKHVATPPPGASSGAGQPEKPVTAIARPERRGTDASIRERIATLKRLRPEPKIQESGFHFDPSQPLHLEDEPS